MKKTVSALVLAGAFAAPMMAATPAHAATVPSTTACADAAKVLIYSDRNSANYESDANYANTAAYFKEVQASHTANPTTKAALMKEADALYASATADTKKADFYSKKASNVAEFVMTCQANKTTAWNNFRLTQIKELNAVKAYYVRQLPLAQAAVDEAQTRRNALANADASQATLDYWDSVIAKRANKINRIYLLKRSAEMSADTLSYKG